MSEIAEASGTVKEARDAFMRVNGFELADYEERWTVYSVLGVRFPLPNTETHRRGIMLHDLHHLVTGYGTDLRGEWEISAWEAAGGLRGVGIYSGVIVWSATLFGFALTPRRVWRAWRAGRRARNLYVTRLPLEEVLEMPLAELRAALGVPPEGITQHGRLHDFAAA